MKIRYEPLMTGFPPLGTVKPVISTADRELARLSPPPALPLHCKPWVDAASFGLLLRFPFRATLTVTIRDDGLAEARMQSALARHIYSDLASGFAKGHFGLSCGYFFKTDPGVGIFTNPLPAGYSPKGTLIPGLVETWRYPKNIFLVFKNPVMGQTLTFEFGDPLCVLMPVLCEPVVAERMSADDVRDVRANRERWEEYLALHPELGWVSAEGSSFTHLYKVMDRKPVEPGPIDTGDLG